MTDDNYLLGQIICSFNCVRNYGAASFSIYFFLLIFLMVCCKQGLVAEAEAVLSFIIF